MILFSSVGHGLIEFRQGFPIRVGALADRVRSPRLPATGAGDCASRSEVNRSAHGAVGVRLVRQAIPVQ